MFKNYLKIAIRNLAKHKGFTAINIAGLSIGIVCCLLILLYVRHELSYDRYFEKSNRIYRIAFSGSFGGEPLDYAAVAAPTAQALLDDYSEVEAVTRLYTLDPRRTRVQNGDKTFVETGIVYADSSVFDVFSIPLLIGDPTTVLSEPNTIVISQSMAEKYFGERDPLGEILSIDSATDYLVTGVFSEIPANTHFHFDFFAALATLEDSRDPWWLNNMTFRTYLVVREGAEPADLEAKFPRMIDKYCAPMLERLGNRSFAEMKRDGLQLRYYLQPVTDIHLFSDLAYELEPNGDNQYVYIFSAVAIIILLIACINFMNLSTARSSIRAKEVGIRKVVGSFRRQLVTQFLAESVLLSIVALLVALVLMWLALPFFNQLAGTPLSALDAGSGLIGLALVAAVVFVGLAAGSYPAIVLSALKPIKVLKQAFASDTRSRWMRSGLVVFQFAISITLIIGAVFVYKQLSFIHQKKLGFNRDLVLVVHDVYLLGHQIESFKNELLSAPAIVSATVSSYLPVTSERTEDVMHPDGAYQESGTAMQKWRVDFDYVTTMGMEIVEGRDFSRAYATDSTAIIVNEAAVRHFGWEDPIGKEISDLASVDPHVYDYFPVIGVVEDFHFESLRDYISPLVLFIGASTDYVSIRLRTKDIHNVIEGIEEVWRTFLPGQLFEYSFLDERYTVMYRAEQRVVTIFSIFAALAIFVGCLGLLGLAAHTAERRTKEIGIRKIMGASFAEIVFLLSRSLVKWVILANVIAWPAAYLLMNRWLEDFAYRVGISWEVFFMSGVAALLIAWLTVSFQAVQAARTNPVKVLKYE